MRLLGQVTCNSAAMEKTLRDAFCSLAEGKFAAVAVVGQNVKWLIEQCESVTDVHKAMTQSNRDAIKVVLRLCKAAHEKLSIHGSELSHV